jgi:hypothetical protein
MSAPGEMPKDDSEELEEEFPKSSTSAQQSPSGWQHKTKN